MDGFTEAAGNAAVNAVRDLMRKRHLEVWVEVRDTSGNAIYSILAASGVQLDDEVTVTHKVGDVQVGR